MAHKFYQNKQSADEFAESMKAIIEKQELEAFTIYQAIRDELNNRSISAYREVCKRYLNTVFQFI